MRIAVIADVHANLAALEAVLQDIDREQIRKILCLGDMIGYGPDPEEVIRQLHARQAVMISGNHEHALANRNYFNQMNPDPKFSLQLTMQLLSPESFSFATGLETVLVLDDARLVHGCPPRSPTCYLYYPTEKMLERIFAGYPERLCFHGHTHTVTLFQQGKSPERGIEAELRTYQLETGQRYIINPGSVGQPRDGINKQAKYLIWDQNRDTVTFKAMRYDVMSTVRKLRQLHFPDFNAERLMDKT